MLDIYAKLYKYVMGKYFDKVIIYFSFVLKRMNLLFLGSQTRFFLAHFLQIILIYFELSIIVTYITFYVVFKYENLMLKNLKKVYPNSNRVFVNLTLVLKRSSNKLNRREY